MSIFNKVQAPSLQKYKYNLSHEFKLSTNFSYLTPIGMKEVLPGDTFKMNTELFLRMAPLVHPILQRINVDIHHFFVPYRLIWSGWEDFITGKVDNHMNLKVNKVPTITFGQLNANDAILKPNSLPHYFGVPLCRHQGLTNSESVEVSQLPFRAYLQIYNDYYRDSIKQEEVYFDKDTIDLDYSSSTSSNSDIARMLSMRLRAYSQDYFTTAQPNPQYGNPAVLPTPTIDAYGFYSTPESTDGAMQADSGELYPSASLDTSMVLFNQSGNYETVKQANVQDVVETEPFTINKLRELFGLQKLFDTSNKFGERYIEQVFGHFGVKSSDARLQRAQYLGGGRIPIQINQVSQLSESTEDSPLGYQAGQGFAAGSNNYFDETFEEHGIIISILSILPEANYTSGIDKFMLKKDRFDFAFPELSMLGEQEVSKKEWNIELNENEAFGYQERYAEYKTAYNRCAGDFLTSLINFYVQTNQEQTEDVRDATFVADPRDLQNIFAITDGEVDKFYIQCYHQIEKYTVLPYLNRTPNPTSYV